MVFAISGVSRISARGVLKVRPDTESGGGQSASGPRYKNWRGGGGGGAVRFRSDAFVWHTEKYVIINNKRLQF